MYKFSEVATNKLLAFVNEQTLKVGGPSPEDVKFLEESISRAAKNFEGDKARILKYLIKTLNTGYTSFK